MPPATVLLSAKYAYRPEYAVESSLSKGNSFFERSAFHLSTVKPGELEIDQGAAINLPNVVIHLYSRRNSGLSWHAWMFLPDINSG